MSIDPWTSSRDFRSDLVSSTTAMHAPRDSKCPGNQRRSVSRSLYIISLTSFFGFRQVVNQINKNFFLVLQKWEEIFNMS